MMGWLAFQIIVRHDSLWEISVLARITVNLCTSVFKKPKILFAEKVQFQTSQILD
jgi:hypothetical protein